MKSYLSRSAGIGLLACLVSLPTSSFAEESSWWANATEDFWGVWGLGVNYRQNNYSGSDNTTGVAPYIFGGVGKLTIEANRASYRLYRDGTWFASAVANLRTHQYREATNTLDERKRSFELGAQVGRRLGAGFVTRLALVQDVSGVHKSQEWDWQLYRRDFFGDNLALLTAVGVQYQTEKLVDYYYGTDTYKPSGALVGELEAIATYYFLDDWAAFVGGRYYHFSSEVTDSPVVDSDFVLTTFAGIGYSF